MLKDKFILQAEEWLKKAEEDEFVAKTILEEEGFPSPICFHSQQLAEKILKALLISIKIKFPKSHDLVALAALIETKIPEIKNYQEEIKTLNQYYVETRYPGDYPEFTAEEAKEALGAATKIKDFVLEKIKK